MKFRWRRLLLLLVFAFWATGTGRALHERLEHCPHAQLTERSPATQTADLSMGLPDEAEHCHNECAVCSMLAHMAASGCETPTVVVAADPRTAVLAIADSQAPRHSYQPFLPSRGPPQPRSGSSNALIDVT